MANALQQVQKAISGGIQSVIKSPQVSAVTKSPIFQQLDRDFEGFVHSAAPVVQNTINQVASYIPFTPQNTSRIQQGYQQLGQQFPSLGNIKTTPINVGPVKFSIPDPYAYRNEIAQLNPQNIRNYIGDQLLKAPTARLKFLGGLGQRAIQGRSNEPFTPEESRTASDMLQSLMSAGTMEAPEAVSGPSLPQAATRAYATYLKGLKKYGISPQASPEEIGNAFETSILNAEGDPTAVSGVLKDFRLLNRIKPDFAISNTADAVDWFTELLKRPKAFLGVIKNNPIPHAEEPIFPENLLGSGNGLSRIKATDSLDQLTTLRTSLVLRGLTAENAGNISLANKLKDEVVKIDKAIEKKSPTLETPVETAPTAPIVSSSPPAVTAPTAPAVSQQASLNVVSPDVTAVQKATSALKTISPLITDPPVAPEMPAIPTVGKITPADLGKAPLGTPEKAILAPGEVTARSIQESPKINPIASPPREISGVSIGSPHIAAEIHQVQAALSNMGYGPQVIALQNQGLPDLEYLTQLHAIAEQNGLSLQHFPEYLSDLWIQDIAKKKSWTPDDTAMLSQYLEVTPEQFAKLTPPQVRDLLRASGKEVPTPSLDPQEMKQTIEKIDQDIVDALKGKDKEAAKIYIDVRNATRELAKEAGMEDIPEKKLKDYYGQIKQEASDQRISPEAPVKEIPPAAENTPAAGAPPPPPPPNRLPPIDAESVAPTPPSSSFPPSPPDSRLDEVFDMLGQVAEAPKEKLSVPRVLREVQKRVQSEYAFLDKYVNDAQKDIGRPLESGENPSMQAEIYTTGTRAMVEQWKEMLGDQVLMPALKAGVKKDLSAYVTLIRFQTRIDQLFKTAQDLLAGDNLDREDAMKIEERIVKNEVNPRGFSPEQIRTAIADLQARTGDKFPLIEDLANRTWEVNRMVLLQMMNRGMVGQDLGNRLLENYKGYMPFETMQYATDTLDGTYVPTKKNLNVDYSDYIMKLKGTTDDIVDPYATMLKKMDSLAVSERNRIFNALYKAEEAKGTLEVLNPPIRPVGRVKHTAEIDPQSMGIIRDLASKLDVKFGTKLKMRNKLGYFRAQGMSDNGQIVRRFGSSTLTALHELGHAIDHQYGLSDIFVRNPTVNARFLKGYLKFFRGRMPKDKQAVIKEALKLNKQVQKELRDLADLRMVQKTYGRKTEEKIATLFAWAVHNPTETQRVAPTAYKLFERFLDNHPEFKSIKDIRPPSLVQGLENMSERVFGRSAGKPKPPEGKGMVNGFRDGKLTYLAVDKDVADAIEGMSNRAMGPVMRSLGRLNIIPKGAYTTANLAFSVPNVYRDVQRSATISKYGIKDPVDAARFLGDESRGFIAAVKDTDPLHMIYKFGRMSGSTRQRVVTPDTFEKKYKNDTTRKRIMGKTHVLKGIIQFNNYLEETTKIATMLRGLRDNGLLDEALTLKTPEEVVNFVNKNKNKIDDIALEVINRGGSPNFNKFGTWGREINTLLLFTNADMQATASDLARITAPTKEGNAARWRTLFLRIIPSILITVYATNSAGKKFRKKVDDYIKNDNDVIPLNITKIDPITGEEKQVIVTLPKERGVLGAISNITEAIVDYAMDADPEVLANMASAFISLLPVKLRVKTGVPLWKASIASLLSSAMPVAKIPIELATNYDTYRMQPIISAGLQRLAPPLQVNSSTTEFAKWLGAKQNTSPILIDHAVYGLLGDTGKNITRIYDVLSGKNRSIVLSAENLPVINRFYRTVGDSTRQQALNDMFANITTLGQLYNSYKMYLNQGKRDEAMSLVKQNPEILRYNSLQNIVSKISEQQKFVRNASQTPGVTEDQKNTILKNSRQTIDGLLNMVGPVLDSAVKKAVSFEQGAGNTVQAAEESPKPVTLTPPSTDLSGSNDLTLAGIPTLDDINEQNATGKKPINVPTLGPVSDTYDFQYQLDTMNTLVDSLASRIKSIRSSPSLSDDTKRKYDQLYSERLNEALAKRDEILKDPMNSDYLQSYLSTTEGVAWAKKQAKLNKSGALVKASLPSTAVAKTTSTKVKKAKTTKVKTTKAKKTSTKTTIRSLPRLKFKPMKAYKVPNFAASIPRTKIMAPPPLKLGKIKLPKFLKVRQTIR